MSSDTPLDQANMLSWDRDGETQSARWISLNGAPAPKNVVCADDSLRAEDAYRMLSSGQSILWTGDYHNARQLMQAVGRRIPAFDRSKGKKRNVASTVGEDFYRYRQARSHRAKMLGSVLVPLGAGPAVTLRRAPDITAAWRAAGGEITEASVTPLTDVLGVIGAHEWRKNGLWVEVLGETLFPHYGTFAPIRSEYLDLVDAAELPSTDLAFDIGTGTGVLAAILAQRGVKKVVAVDSEPRAIACAAENLGRFPFGDRVELVLGNMFPDGKAPLIVCNPPWLPGTAHTLLDNAIYDPKSRMLKAFLQGLAGHLEVGGEGWLIISDIAERLELRSREELLDWIAAAGLQVKEKIDTAPFHPRSMDREDPFFKARSGEVTSLWKLVSATA